MTPLSTDSSSSTSGRPTTPLQRTHMLNSARARFRARRRGPDLADHDAGTSGASARGLGGAAGLDSLDLVALRTSVRRWQRALQPTGWAARDRALRHGCRRGGYVRARGPLPERLGHPRDLRARSGKRARSGPLGDLPTPGRPRGIGFRTMDRAEEAAVGSAGSPRPLGGQNPAEYKSRPSTPIRTPPDIGASRIDCTTALSRPRTWSHRRPPRPSKPPLKETAVTPSVGRETPGGTSASTS